MKHEALMRGVAMAALMTWTPACEAEGGGDVDADGSGTESSTQASTTASSGGTGETEEGDESGDGDAGSDGSGESTDSTTDDTGDVSEADTSDGSDESGGSGDCGADPGWTERVIGNPVKHVEGVTAEGEVWNSCELTGTPWLFDLSTVWCSPCNNIAAYLSGQHDDDPWGFPGFTSVGPEVRALIENDTIVWVTFLTENVSEGPSAQSDAAAWDEAYPHDKLVTIVEGDTWDMNEGMGVSCFPSFWLIDEANQFATVDECNHVSTMNQMLEDYG